LKKYLAALGLGLLFLTGCDGQRELKRSGFYLDNVFEVQIKISDKKENVRPAQTALNAAFDKLVELDTNLNKLSPLSEISALNANAAWRSLEISRSTYDLIEKALNASAFTDGYFDITWQPLIKIFALTTPTAERLAKAKASLGYKNIALDRSLARVRYLNNAEIDFDHIKCGFAVDLLGNYLKKHALSGQIKAGGVAYYFGAKKLSLKLTEKENLNLKLNDAAVAVLNTQDSYYVNSSAWRKYLPVASPVEPIHQIIVIAPNAVTAEILAEAFYFMGVEKSLQKIAALKKQASRQNLYEVYFVRDNGANGQEVVSSAE
jgi:thiamine biosynthesis lipoprotein